MLAEKDKMTKTKRPRMEQGPRLETLRKKIESRRLGTRYTRHEYWIHGRTLRKASIRGTTVGLQGDLVVDDTEKVESS